MRTRLFAYIALLSVVACTEEMPPLDFDAPAPAARKKGAGAGATEGEEPPAPGRKPPSSRGDAGPPPDMGSSGGSSSGGSSSGGSSSSSSSSSGASGGAGTCGGAANKDACYTCCDQESPVGFELYFLTFDACVCDAPATCADACGSNFCVGGAESAACAACKKTAFSCWDTAELSCAANPLCRPYQTCGVSCEALP
jgi:hypothetical protein